jgi:peptide-methionine (S)-S-oxide reductase
MSISNGCSKISNILVELILWQSVLEAILGRLMKNFLLAALLTALTLAGPSARAATAILAGGCFWCMEADFEKLEGVSDVVSGFTGGTHPDPSYNGGHTGHYEAVLSITRASSTISG